MPLGIRPTVDFVFKLLFGSVENSDLLIHLLNAVLEPESPIEAVEILNPFNDKQFEDDKLSIVDVKARNASGAWYVIEIQTSVPAELRNRLVFYTAELFARQMTDGTSYGELRPAISICFLTEPLFRELELGHLRFALHDAVHSVAFGDQIQLHLVQLSNYDFSRDELPSADAFSRWVYFLTRSQNCEPHELRELLTDDAFTKATGILEMIAKSPELRLLYDDRAKEAKDRYSEIKDAKAQGRAEGRAEGHTEGQRNGMLIGQIQVFARLLGKSITELESKSTDELAKLLADLERQFEERDRTH